MLEIVCNRLHWLLLRVFLEGLFRIAYPLLSRLPAASGLFCSKLLGLFCAHFDFDWRTVALRNHFVSSQSRRAFAEINPALAPTRLDSLVRQRFIRAAYEELEGHWLALQRGAEFSCSFEGIEEIRKCLDQKTGIVLLTFHFDAAIMGIAQLGRAGLSLSPMSSSVVENPLVPRSVRAYFHKKYIGLNSFLNGGHVMHAESYLRAFYAKLRRGEGIVVLGDAYAQDLDNAVVTNFLGRRRAFAPGAVRLAEKTGTPMAAFVCLRQEGGSYRIIFSPVYCPENGSHATNTAKLYAFLDEQIRRYPERWWAADLLPDFTIIAP